MSKFRKAIANLIAPELSRNIEALEHNCSYWRAKRDEIVDIALEQRIALHQISAQRTRGANATVKRMADIADNALKVRQA